MRVLGQLREMGIRVSIDDFGTGHSSLAYLKRFPLDTLKIDRSFVSNVASNRYDAAIAVSVITLAHSMDLRVVAEGVETEAQRAFLSKQGCDAIQGYLTGAPAPAPQLGLSPKGPVTAGLV
jgi:EAL domain-containing protein (putative c-di-GMP-specific phosphodiesterase class I)